MVVMVQLWPRRRLGGAGPNRFDRLGLAVFDTYLKKWAGDGTAEGGVFDGDVPSSSFSITVEDMELHHFASLTSCLFYFSGKKRIASPSTILVGRTVPIHEPVLVLMHSILVEASELAADP